MTSTLLEKGPAKEETYTVDTRCPLFHEAYSLAEAKREVKGNSRWRALYGEESITAGLLLAESRECGDYLGGHQALSLLKQERPLYHLPRPARYAANLYFSDPAAIEAGQRVYDPGKSRFFSASEIRKHLFASFKPLGQDISAYLYPGEGYPLLSFDARAGQEVLIPLGTPLLFLGPYKHDDEEILLHPDARLEKGRFLYPSFFKEKMEAHVARQDDQLIFSLHEL